MHRLSAKQLSEEFKRGRVSAKEIAAFFLKRIERADPYLDAFLSVLSDRVMQKADELDRKKQLGKSLGKLAGVPVALKDNMHIKGELTTCASKFLSNYRAVFDATVTKLLEEEDALLIGKTNLDEFAMGSSTENSAFKKTKNPWDITSSPGGSSGGSAAAVASRMCPVALGSDTGGSIRQPAALCGIVGFKPTYGRVSRYGLVAFGSSLDQIGPLTRTVEDTALVMEVIGKHCAHDSTSIPTHPETYTQLLHQSIEKKIIGVPWHLLESLSPEVKANFEAALNVFRKSDVKVIDIELKTLSATVAIYYILATAEASTNLARFDGIRYGVRSPRADTLDEVYDLSRQDGFGYEVKRRILLGTYVLSAGYKDAYYKKAQQVRTLMIQEHNNAFDRCDIIALPTSPLPAFLLGSILDPLQMYLLDIFTIGANITGLPAINVPSGFTSHGKPLGLQLTGPVNQDALVLNFANHFESKTEYYKKTPSMFEANP